MLIRGVAVVVLLVVSFSAHGADPDAVSLTKSDKEFLLGLVGSPLTDPTGKQYCSVEVIARSCWGSSDSVRLTGWSEPSKKGKPGRVYFLDGDWLDAPKKVKQEDFLAESRKLLKPADVDDDRATFRRMRLTAAGPSAPFPTLARAAWLAKLGEDQMAARVLAQLRGDEQPSGDDTERDKSPNQGLISQLNHNLAWRAFSGGVHAYMQRADAEALRHIQRLKDKYPGHMTKFGDGDQLLAELIRRKKAGTFSKPALEKPKDFAEWSAVQKVTWLTEQLDQVDARQDSQPGGVSLASDWRVRELIMVGDVAVEPLIDVLENDTRLTRSVHFWRDFSQSRTVLSVREAALTAVMSILKVRVFEVASTGDNFTNRGDEAAKTTVARLRAYWKKYGSMPFEDRMMNVLTDEKSNPEATREAAMNLARLGESRAFGTTVWSDVHEHDPEAKKKPNPAVKKFSNPTAAEAILAAMDRDLAQHDANERDNLYEYRRRQIESEYLHAIILLGDTRMAKPLRERSEKTRSIRMRRKYTSACHDLGDSEPINKYANEFKVGRIQLPKTDDPQWNWNDQEGVKELAGIIQTLASADTPQAQSAIWALSDPKHPAYKMAARSVRELGIGWHDQRGWFLHPYCIAILRRDLDDKTSTGKTLFVKDDLYLEEYDRGSSSTDIPEIIADPAKRNDRVAERRCDAAATKISRLVIGLPAYHPLLKDADERIDQMRKQLDETVRKLRHATPAERKRHNRVWGPAFMADEKST
jgi:hypothetical protein